MDCVNHPGVPVAAYCQNCGKALCSGCMRHTPAGQILCDSCFTAWQGIPHPFIVEPPSGGPHPVVAAILGFIPGVGAMYNGQFFKGFIHVVIFAMLVSMAHHVGVFGILIAGWVFYQVFEAYHTARARRDGQPLPDPLGLNEAINTWFNPARPPYPGSPYSGSPYSGQPYSGQPGANPAQVAADQPPGQAPPGYPPTPGAWQPPYQDPYRAPYGGPIPPPVPPLHWRRREPVAAVVLIALGVLFLLGQWDIFSGRLLEFTWPVLLIALGAWLIIRRLHDSQGGSQ